MRRDEVVEIGYDYAKETIKAVQVEWPNNPEKWEDAAYEELYRQIDQASEILNQPFEVSNFYDVFCNLEENPVDDGKIFYDIVQNAARWTLIEIGKGYIWKYFSCSSYR